MIEARQKLDAAELALKNKPEHGGPPESKYRADISNAQAMLAKAQEEYDEKSSDPFGLFLDGCFGTHLAKTVNGLVFALLFALLSASGLSMCSGKRQALSCTRAVCGILLGILMLYVAASVLVLAYVWIDNTIKGAQVFAARRVFSLFTLVYAVAWVLLMSKACTLLRMFGRSASVSNEASLSGQAGWVSVIAILILLGTIGLTLPFGANPENAILTLNISSQVELTKLPEWYTAFVYQGKDWFYLVKLGLTAILAYYAGQVL